MGEESIIWRLILFTLMITVFLYLTVIIVNNNYHNQTVIQIDNILKEYDSSKNNIDYIKKYQITEKLKQIELYQKNYDCQEFKDYLISNDISKLKYYCDDSKKAIIIDKEFLLNII